MRFSKTLLLFSVLAAEPLVAGGSDDGMAFVDLRTVDRSAVSLMSLGAPRIVATRDLPLVTRTDEVAGFGRPTERLQIDASSLVPFRSGRFHQQAPVTVSRFSVGETFFDLSIVDVTFDSSFGVYHVAAIPVGQADGYARFTVDLADGTVVGTIYAAEQIWRVTPDEGNGHLVRAVSPAAVGERNDTRTTTNSGERRSRLERRHVQMLRLAELQPKSFNTDASGVLAYVRANEIERVDMTKVLLEATSAGSEPRVDTATLELEFNAALQRQRSLLMIEEPLVVRINSAAITASADRRSLVITYSQIVDDIPVEPDGIAVIDTVSGAVTSLTAPFVHSAEVPRDRNVWLDETRARELGSLRIAEVHLTTAAAVDAKLAYVRQAQRQVSPQWTIHYRGANGKPYVATINARTAETIVTEALLRNRQVVCVANGPTPLTCGVGAGGTPPPLGAWKVSDLPTIDGNPTCYPFNKFNCAPYLPGYQRYIEAFDRVEEFEQYVLGSGTPGPNHQNWGTIKVVTDHPGLDAGIPDYATGLGTIRLPPRPTPSDNTGYYAPEVDPLDPAHRWVIFHELAHHYQTKLGPATGGSSLMRVLGEGLADAVAGDMTGNWNLGPGTVRQQMHERNLYEDRFLTDLPQASEHVAGMVFGNMMYRIGNRPGVSSQAHAKLILQTYSHMRPDRGGDPAVYDVADVYHSMVEVAGGDAALQQAISDVWAIMGGTAGPGSGDSGSGGPSGGVPPPPSAPLAPAFVDGYPQGCNGTQSLHVNYWTPAYGATSYDVYYRVPGFPGAYVYEFTTSQTSAPTANTVDVDVKVKACNANGCSWLSVDSYTQLDMC